MKKNLLLLITLLGCFSVYSANIYVAKTGDNSNDGSDWDNAKLTMPSAFSAASANDTIFVAAGVYEFSTPLTVNKAITMMGGYLVESGEATRNKVENGKAWEFANPTIFRGVLYTGTGTNTDTKNSRIFHVTAANAEFNGLQFENGGGKHTGSSELGGAIYSNQLGTKLLYCSFINNGVTKKDNSSGGMGGGIYLSASDAVIESCYFKGNYADDGASGGGGAYVAPGSGVTVTVNNCVFDSNTSTTQGAGLRTHSANKTIVKNTIFVKNVAIASGTLKAGAALYINTNSVNEVENCVFYNNSGSSGVFLFGAFMRNCTYVNNIGHLSSRVNTVKLYNTIIWGNTHPTTGVPVAIEYNQKPAEIKNCALTSLDADYTAEENANLILNADNDDEDGPNFKVPTSFVGAGDLSEETPDWRLENAATIKSGGLTANAPATDILGETRGNTKCSIGAYENNSFYTSTAQPNNSGIRFATVSNTLFVQSANPLAIQIIALNGQQIASATLATNHSFNLAKGMYVVVATDRNGSVSTSKVIIQ